MTLLSKHWPKLGLLVAVVAVAIIWQTWQSIEASKQLKASGTIQTTEIAVGSRVGGRIAQVLVSEGAMVSEGQTLATLEGYQLPAQEAAISAQIVQAEAQLKALISGARPQEVAAAKAQWIAAEAQANQASVGFRAEDIAQAKADFSNAESTYSRLEKLASRHVVSLQERDNAKAAYDVAKARYEELKTGNRPQEVQAAKAQAESQKARLSLLKAGSRAEDIAAQRAVVEALKAQKEQILAATQELRVSSPCRCEVSALDLKPGQLILANQSLASLMNLQDLWVRVYIPEERFGQVKPGDTAQVRVDAYPNKTFTGKVIQVASQAEFTPRNVQTQEARKMQVFGIKVAIDNQQKLLRPGMPADITFTVDSDNASTGTP